MLEPSYRCASLQRRLTDQHARAREAELVKKFGEVKTIFGGPVRSKEKFERQLELTQELERLLLKKDQEITRLRSRLRAWEQDAEKRAAASGGQVSKPRQQ